MSPFLLVVVVIPDSEIRSQVKAAFERTGHRLIECDSCQQAQMLLSNGLSADLLVMSAPAADPDEISSHLWLLNSASGRVCLVAAPGEESFRKRASALGVEHILTSPVTHRELEQLLYRLNLLVEERTGDENADSRSGVSRQLKSDMSANMPARPYIEELGDGRFFLAASPQMLEIHHQVRLLADADVNVLILGESGTGKEVIAQLIHHNSRRARERFLKVNCAALPADLLESELFGHRQGAFTGAVKDQPGKFEQAHGGSLLLDEIGEIGVHIQAKLLHVLQDGQFTRLGGQSCTRVNVRVLAATNVQMESALLNKTFREDLYYRLSVFTIHVPPLRERREEIPYFIEETIRRAPSDMKMALGVRLPSQLIDAALLYDWPGNLRELHNFVTRMIIMRDLDGAARELEAKIESGRNLNRTSHPQAKMPAGAGMRSVVRDLKEQTERQMIQDALDACRWNRRRAAQYLNISYRALLYKIQQHRLAIRASNDHYGPSDSILSAWESGQ